jgi:nodulation protein E
MILGEGAGMLVLEDMDAALARGANVYGENRGLRHVVRRASHNAAFDGRACSGHAGRWTGASRLHQCSRYGTAANDSTEAAAIRSLFGDSVAVSSTKSMHGHALGLRAHWKQWRQC